MKRLLGLLALVSLSALACGNSSASTPAANTYDVQVDAKYAAYNFQATSYFPNALKAHPGDSIRFTSVDRGEPHTVTFGTAIDAAAAAYATLTPGAPRPAGPPPAAITDLPDLIAIGNGPPHVVSSAAQPCFLTTGLPPPAITCTAAQQKQPDFNGKQAYFNSGYLPDNATFTVKLASSITPGVYSFLCMLHKGQMVGKLTVVASGGTADTTAQVKAAGTALINKYATALQGSIDSASKAPASNAVAGVFPSDPSSPAQGAVFGPKELAVPVGGSVTWTVTGPHTISFNAPESAKGPLQKGSDGLWTLNLLAVAPVPPPPGPPPAGPPPTKLNFGPYDGKDFRSTGLILSFPPVLTTVTFTFTTAGSYKFKCLIHPDMEGTLKVG